MTQFSLPNLKTLPFGGAGAISDGEMKKCIELIDRPFTEFLDDTTITGQYLETYQTWLHSSVSNVWKGLEKFSYATYCNATTEAFDKFYMKNSQRRFRCFRGEYMYHQLTWRNCWPTWKYINDEPLQITDAVVVSLPFADSGGVHEQYHETMDTCSRLGIPVLVDCAYFGICYNMELDVSYDCITDLTFSLSKTFPVSNMRIGMRLTKIDDDDPLFVLNKTNYTNRVGAGVGMHLLQKFDADYISNTYRHRQEKFCKILEATVSNCVIFGLGDKKWQQYNRGTNTNRLSLFKYLHLDHLPESTLINN